MAKRRLKKGKIFACLLFFVAVVGLFFAVPTMLKEKKAANSNSVTTAANETISSNGPKNYSDSTNKSNSDSNKSSNGSKNFSTNNSNSNSGNTTAKSITVKGETDNWAGWYALYGANLGNTTSPDSKFGKSGLDVTITPVDSDEEKLQHLINGDIDFTACTINRLSLISGELSGADTAIVVPLFTDASNGGDGIVAHNEFTSIESLKNATIGVGEGSVSHAIVVWAIQQTDMSETDKAQIISNIKTYPSAAEAKDAYLNGEINALSTWQPYIDETIASGDSHVILSTKTSSSLVMDALFFRKDFAEAHPDIVEAMVDGILSVVEDMKTGSDLQKAEYCEVFRNSLPDFASSSDDEIMSMLDESTLLDWHQNVAAFENTASSMFFDMCAVWESIGYETYPEFGDNIFDDSYIQNLSSKYKNTAQTSTSKVSVTDENKQQVIDTEALLTKTTTVNFKPQTSMFMDDNEAAAALDEFVKIAKILDGSIIQIEGNVSSRNTTEAEVKLSEQRAETVKNYLVSKGVSESRIITIGNGGYKPVYADPQTSEEYKQNRRVDLFFKIIEEY